MLGRASWSIKKAFSKLCSLTHLIVSYCACVSLLADRHQLHNREWRQVLYIHLWHYYSTFMHKCDELKFEEIVSKYCTTIPFRYLIQNRLQQSVGIIWFCTANMVEKGIFSPEPPAEAHGCFHIFPKVHLFTVVSACTRLWLLWFLSDFSQPLISFVNVSADLLCSRLTKILLIIQYYFNDKQVSFSHVNS